MSHKYDVSICMPAHRSELWEDMYNTIAASVTPYTWELILVGPNYPSAKLMQKPNFKFLKDFGNPTRCAQIATSLAEGRLMMWGSDDGIFMENSIKECVELHNNSNQIDVIILRYSEGENHTGKMPPDNYWTAKTHPDQRLPGIPDDAKIAPVGMYQLDYFRYLGGWDCRFEHLNMCTHDLAFRAQKNGSNFLMSPSLVASHDWNPGRGDHIPVQQAYHANDLPLFNSIYGKPEPNRDKIDYFNWIHSPSKWIRRFKN